MAEITIDSPSRGIIIREKKFREVGKSGKGNAYPK
jgi:hypothetical protein